jgi:hypothetical protein
MLRYKRMLIAIISKTLRRKLNDPIPVVEIALARDGRRWMYSVNSDWIVTSDKIDRESNTPIKNVNPIKKLDFVFLYESIYKNNIPTKRVASIQLITIDAVYKVVKRRSCASVG